MASRKTLLIAAVVALLVTSVGSALFPLGFSRPFRDSPLAGVALNVWAVLLAPSILLTGMAFSDQFFLSHFRLVTTLGFVFNVMSWTGVIYGLAVFVARLRRRRQDVPASPA